MTLLTSENAAVRVAHVRTALGEMVACATEDALCLLEFSERRMLHTQLERVRRLFRTEPEPGRNEVIDRAEAELAQYLAGERTAFTVPLDLRGTPFQRRAWEGLLTVPYGQTRSYAAQAERLGVPTAVRAVARANGDNRIAIIVPCHRLVGSDGALTGYGGGLWRKRHLLDLERDTAGAHPRHAGAPPAGMR